MSLHRDTTTCEWVGTDEQRVCLWTGSCDCGWTCPERHPHTNTGPDLARADYREHIEGALGAAAYYNADAACRNCGSHHRQGVLVGTHVSSTACQRCGTRMPQPDNDVWNEDHKRDRLWGF